MSTVLIKICYLFISTFWLKNFFSHWCGVCVFLSVAVLDFSKLSPVAIHSVSDTSLTTGLYKPLLAINSSVTSPKIFISKKSAACSAAVVLNEF